MQDLKSRTKQFSIACWQLCTEMPKSREYDAFVRQLIRCSSSVGANYRAALRGKSTVDFIYKLKIVEEEADESMYWLEIFMEISELNKEKIEILHTEANEILSIIVASIRTARKNQKTE